MKLAAFQSTEQRDAWSIHVQDVFQSLDIPLDTASDHLVASVSMYCRKFHPNGVQSTDLKLLIARVFCAVGNRVTATRVLESMNPHRRHVERWLEILSELHHFPELLPYFSQGIIRPADWAGAQLERMWTLDFGALKWTDAERHEIMLYRSIRALLEKIFIFWDAADGAGILGVKHLASLKMETGGVNKQALTSSDSLLNYLAAILKQQQPLRNWSTVPAVLNLDL